MGVHRRARGAASAVAIVLVTLAWTGGSAEAAHAASVTASDITMNSGGDPVAGARTLLFTPAHDAFLVTGSPASGVTIKVSQYTIGIAPPLGLSLQPGTYLSVSSPASPGTAGGFDIEQQGGVSCPAPQSDFTVHDIGVDGAGQVNRLWISYEHHCLYAGAPPLFGEIRLNEPQADPEVAIAPASLSWPESTLQPGPLRIARSAPVWFTNTSARPFSQLGISVTGADADEFRFVDDTCSAVVVPGATCEVRLQFVPLRAGVAHAALNMSDTSTAGLHVVQLSGTGVSGTSGLITRGDPDDLLVGPYNAVTTTDQNHTIVAGVGTANPNGDEIIVRVGELWQYESAAFGPPAGQQLQSGHTYFGATPQNSAAARLAFYPVAYCATETGQFTVLELVRDPTSGAVLRFSAMFEAHCGAATAAAHGWVSYRATNPNAPTDLLTSGQDAAARGAQVTKVAVLTVRGQPLAGRTLQVSRTDLAGTVALPDVATDGSGGATVRDVPRSGGPSTYRFSYAGDPVHSAVEATTVVDVSRPATPLTFTASGRVFRYGGLATYSVHLGQPTTRRQVEIDEYVYGGSAAWTHVRTATVDAWGNYSFSVNMYRHISYQVRFAGDSDHAPAVAATYATALAGFAFHLSAYSYSGVYLLNHSSAKPLATLLISPPRGAVGCVAFETQTFVGTVWRAVSTTACRPFSAYSYASAYEPASHPLGVPFRVRAVLPSDTVNAATSSGWIYFRYTT